MTQTIKLDKLTTTELANALERSPGTIRNNLSQKGNFWGVTPLKAPSGALLWPVEPFLPFIRKSLEG